VRKASYLIPAGLVGAVAWWARPSWWALAMLLAGALFAWDFLWGDRRVLDPAHGLRLVGLGAAVLVVATLLAMNLGLDLAEFQALARGLRKRESFLYQLPAMGVGLVLYGLLVWSRAWSRGRED
jgi:hypothetical protein